MKFYSFHIIKIKKKDFLFFFPRFLQEIVEM